MEENNTNPNPTNPSCDTLQPIVTYVLIFLNIMISLGKQFLNNNKHLKLNSNVDSILTGIRRENIPLNTNALITEGEGLINLNIPEHLKTSQKESLMHFPLKFEPSIFFQSIKISPLENIANPNESINHFNGQLVRRYVSRETH